MLAQGRDNAGLAQLRAPVLLAPPFAVPGGWPFEGYHFEQPPAPEALAGLRLHLYFGMADRSVPPAHAALDARFFPEAAIHRRPGCGHPFEGWMAHVARDLRALACA